MTTPLGGLVPLPGVNRATAVAKSLCPIFAPSQYETVDLGIVSVVADSEKMPDRFDNK
jgi:hypothetical protein